jgi:hypothetical protein
VRKTLADGVLDLAVALAWDLGRCTVIEQIPADGIAIVAFVREHRTTIAVALRLPEASVRRLRAQQLARSLSTGPRYGLVASDASLRHYLPLRSQR